MADEQRKLDTKEPDFPEIRARMKFNYEQHVKKGIEAGLSREEAERHARHDLQGEDEALVEPDAQLARKDFKDREGSSET